MKKSIFKFKLVYLAALFPLVSTALYLAVMGLSTTEDFLFSPIAILLFLAVTAAWGYIGALFAKSKSLMLPSALIAHVIPTLTTLAYTVLYVIAQVLNDETYPDPLAPVEEQASTLSETLEETAYLIGGLGNGMFSFVGTFLYTIIPMTLFEVYINFIFSILVFVIGYAIGASGLAKKK